MRVALLPLVFIIESTPSSSFSSIFDDPARAGLVGYLTVMEDSSPI